MVSWNSRVWLCLRGRNWMATMTVLHRHGADLAQDSPQGFDNFLEGFFNDGVTCGVPMAASGCTLKTLGRERFQSAGPTPRANAEHRLAAEVRRFHSANSDGILNERRKRSIATPQRRRTVMQAAQKSATDGGAANVGTKAGIPTFASEAEIAQIHRQREACKSARLLIFGFVGNEDWKANERHLIFEQTSGSP